MSGKRQPIPKAPTRITGLDEILEGGLPALGVQGSCPEMVAAPRRVALNSSIAVPARNSRLRTAVGVGFFVTIQGRPSRRPFRVQPCDQRNRPVREARSSRRHCISAYPAIRKRGRSGYSRQDYFDSSFELTARGHARLLTGAPTE